MFQVYFIVNTTNDKTYVGQSVDWKSRIRRHFYALRQGSHHCEHLKSAFEKYGRDAFSAFLVLDCETAEECDAAELFYIEWFRAIGLSYNHMYEGPRGGYTHDDQARAKIGAVHKGRKLSPEHRAQVIAALANREFTPEYRRKLSEANKGNQNWLGKHHTEETKRKLSEVRSGALNPNYGKPRSEEAKRKTSETLKGRQTTPMTDEIRAKISATLTGRKNGPCSEETKAKISAANRGKKRTPRR